MKLEIDNLFTIRSYAKKTRLSKAKIINMVGEKELNVVVIDGVTFINTGKVEEKKGEKASPSFSADDFYSGI